MCSTHKFLAAAFVLQRVDHGEDSLERRIPYAKDNLVTYSPITEKHVGDGMTLGELCEAALTLSDNTAANLILETLGGPAGFTSQARALGDDVTRLDRIETALNEAKIRRSARHDDAGGDGGERPQARARRGAVRALPREVGELGHRQQDRRQAIARGNSERMASRRQDGNGRRRGDQRHRGRLAARPRPARRDRVLRGSAAPDDEREQVLAEVGRLAVGI